MDFPKVLKHCQLERHLTNENFAKLVGKSRTWLQWIYSKNPKVEKFLLSEMTMYDLHTKLDIPMEIMEEYNKYLLQSRYKKDSE